MGEASTECVQSGGLSVRMPRTVELAASSLD